MRADGEAVLRREVVEPRRQVAVTHLDDAMAAVADEVVVVTLAAEAVARLAGVVHQRVDDAALAEERQRPVDSGEADPLVPRLEAGVDLLGGRVVRLAGERLEHSNALPCGADAVLGEERLRAVDHGRTIAVYENDNRSRFPRRPRLRVRLRRGQLRRARADRGGVLPAP